jgi:ATP-dependent RNA helicase HelY
VETIEILADADLLPAITFIFSRKACDQAAAECRDAGVRLTTPAERRRIRQIAEDAVWDLTDADLDALGYDGWLAALEVGVAAHHAGLIPLFKEAVEACFVQGLIKVVFATETLALGINMPARSVVIERLSKYNGESHEFLTPGEFTQLTGRAGRRGLDDEGYAVVPWSPFVTFDQVVGLVASRSFPLVSSFRPTYNMAANLVRRWPRDEAYEIIGQSFAQFQADRAMVGLQRRLHEDRARQESLQAAAHCDRGDVADYVALVERARRAERRTSGRAAIERAASMLRPGELVVLDGEAGSDGAAVIISVAHRAKGSIKVKAVDAGGNVHTLDAAEITTPLRAYGEVVLPVPFAPSDPSFLDQCAELVSENPPDPSRRPAPVEGGSNEADELAAAVLVHPVNRCPDRDLHVESLAELAKVQRETGQLSDAVKRRGGSLARRLDAVMDLLGQRGFVDGWALTAAGEQLTRLYHECDLVIAEALGAGLLDGLDGPGLAAVASTFSYEERRSDPPTVAPLAHGRAADRIGRIGALAKRVQRAERDRGLPQTRLPDAGFAAVALEWARGGELGQVLGAELPAGDFVRNIKILVDLLRQLAEVAPQADTRRAAREGADSLVRGVVATSSEVTTRETATGGGAG